MKLFIFRHGLATKSTTGYGAHMYSAGLLPEGREAINKLGKFLANKPEDYFVSSSFLRCIQTAEIIAKESHKQFLEEKRINEYVDISFENFVSNITSFLEDLRKHKKENIWICTHVADIIVIKKLLKNEPIQESDLFSNYPLPGVLTILEEKTTEEINFNK